MYLQVKMWIYRLKCISIDLEIYLQIKSVNKKIKEVSH